MQDKYYKCVFCNKDKTGYGNNPSPIIQNGRCCNDCDERFVIPIRILEAMKRK